MPPEQQPFTPLAPEGATPVPKPPVPVAPFVAQGASEDEKYSTAGWSWGAFFLNILFAVAIRKHWYLLWMIPMFIPFVNIIVVLGLMIFMGLKGREMAAASPMFTNREQYIGFMKAIDHAGKIFGIFYLVIIVIGIGASVMLASLSGARDRAMEASARQQETSLEAERMYQDAMEESYPY